MNTTLQRGLRLFLMDYLDEQIEATRTKMGNMRNELGLKEWAIRLQELESLRHQLKGCLDGRRQPSHE